MLYGRPTCICLEVPSLLSRVTKHVTLPNRLQPFRSEEHTSELQSLLQIWSRHTKAGIANFAPGVIFADDDDVAPDVIWISQERLKMALQPDGKLHSAPELAIEVLSPGSTNARRDREVKRKLYSRRGVQEYWIVNWQERYVEIYRRENADLKQALTLFENDTLQSPILPEFSCRVSEIFADVLS